MRSESHDLELLADDLERASEEITEQVKKVTAKACLNMKKHAQRLVSGHPHLPSLGRSFSYDVTAKGETVTGEVGAVVGRFQGALDHIIENGTTTSAPIPHWAPAADKERPAWEEYLDQAAVDAVEGRRA